MSQKLDAVDLRILRELQRNADQSMQELAENVGLSHTPCWRRYTRLKELGVIVKKVVVVDAEKIGKGLNALCTVVLERHDEKSLVAFEKATLDCPEIMECYAMSGARDYLLRVAVASVAEYEKFMKQTLLHLPGIGAVDTNFALKTVKLSVALPI
ncbi:MAG TPA: Lrp/AsnC family transcriptional regulator [Steroidobacteraceae bacterium]